MDPDVPIPSIESGQPAPNVSLANNNASPMEGNTPFQSMSPEKTPFKTPASHPTSPAPLAIPKSRSGSRANTPVRERQSTPTLHTKRSHPNLGAGRNTTPQRQSFRRASSNLNPISAGVNGSSDLFGDVVETPPVTAASVAKDYFKRELAYHSTIESKVAVFVHDSCFGHRFSRPRTSKAALSTIVERPERLLATLLGASTAYVRLGKRHTSGSSSPHPDRDPSTAAKPPFVIRKTSKFLELNHPAVTAVHGTKWMEELQIMCDSAEAKLAMNGKELTRPIGYGRDEAGNALPKLHEGDLYLCSESISALQGCLGGVCDAVDAVFSTDTTSRAFVNIRPPGHHCSSNVPSGFCWLNNVHVGISYAAMNHNLTHAAIIDFDLHHGDGSQTITWDHNRNAQSLPKNAAAHKRVPIGYYSLHDINSYPCEWGDEEKVRNASLCLQNAHGQSIWNVHLEPWSSLSEFWQVYESKYKIILQKTREFLKHHADVVRKSGHRPRAAIFLSAGFDASQWESAGMQRHKVNVPTDFYARFTQDIVSLSEEDGIGVDGRVISVLEGGYSDRALTSGVLSHLCGLASDRTGPKDETNTLSMAELSGDMPVTNEQGYTALWWSESHLEELEAMVEGRAPPPVKKTAKPGGNYSSPTQASTLRMTDNARERHSLSSQLETRLALASRTPEPPPEVDWVTASYELSRNLIPGDRQTLSCRHDELNAEATKTRRERQSLLNVPAPSEEKMQLRGRKTRAAVNTNGTTQKSAASTNRRTTIAAVNELPDSSHKTTDEGRPRRRSSTASSVLSSFQDMKISAAEMKPLDRGKAEKLDTANPTVARQPWDIGEVQSTSESRVTRSRSRERSIEQSIASFEAALPKEEDMIAHANNEIIHTRSSSLSRESSFGSSNLTKDGMDDLTAGMKKVSIKLKMPTAEQHEAKQAQLNKEKAKKPKTTTRKPPVPKVPRSNPSTAPKAAKSTTTIRKSGQAIVPARSTPSVRSDPNPTNIMEPPAVAGSISTVQQSVTQDLISADKIQAANAPILTSNTAENQPQLDPIVQTAEDLGRNVGQPTEQNSVPPRPSAPTPMTMMQPQLTPRKTKDDLPVFTSTTPIPFSRLNQNTKEKPSSIWDIPDTPHD